MPTDTLARTFEEYSTRYRNVAMERDDDGVLTVTLHTDGDSLVWTQHAHDALGYCFTDIAADRDNAAVILTGAGESFCAAIDATSFNISTAALWDNIIYEGKRLLTNLLDIEVPVIAAVNGPAIFHPEIPIMSDIVVASETATFQDGPHYCAGVVPGDGAHVVWPHVIGPNRGRYFLLTGQVLDAQTAMDYGAVAEVVPPGQLMDRARALAADVAAKPFLTRRYSRAALTQSFKRALAEGIHMGLALEGLAALDQWPTEGTLKQG